MATAPRRSRSSTTTRSSASAKTSRPTATKAKARTTKRGGSSRKRRGRKAKGGILSYLPRINWRHFLSFPYLVVALLIAVVYVHKVRVAVWGEAGADEGRGFGAPTAQLASFSHPASHSTGDVQQLRADYVNTYGPLAQEEMRAHGIPASITLAQGLLESVAGTSKLATRTNNHFGIKCFSKKCSAGHCRNFSDDHHKDFFRAYDHPRESYRAHSEFLSKGKRYAGLFKLDSDDYKGWARGLSKAGYATDPKYADKLIALVDRYDLDDWDEGSGWW